MVTVVKQKKSRKVVNGNGSVKYVQDLDKVRLSRDEESLLKAQSTQKIGLEDLRVALECVRIVQAGYQRKLNEMKEQGDVYNASICQRKRDRLLRWMQDYTKVAELSGNCQPGGVTRLKEKQNE